MTVYGLLADYTVLDLSRTLPGPFCTWLLAGLGARVLSVAEPRRRDAERVVPALDDARDRIVYRNKRRLTLNLKNQEGRRIFFRLLERADVVVEDFRPGVATRLGVDYEAVSRAQPSTVYCSISAFGQDGPYRHLPAHDVNCLALAGLLDLTGPRGGPPALPASQLADLAAGSAAAVAILAALLARGPSGQGRYVDVAMLDATFSWMLIPLVFQLAGRPPARGDWVLGGSEPFYGAYRCKDGAYFSVGCLEPWLWQNLLRALDVTEPSPTSERLAALFATRTRDEWWALLSDADACVAPVRTLEEALADPQLRHRGAVREWPDGVQLGLPFALPDTAEEPLVDGPERGADTAAILAELGLADGEIDRLRSEGAV